VRVTASIVPKRVAKALAEIADKYKIFDSSMVADIYTIFKYGGRSIKADVDLQRDIRSERGDKTDWLDYVTSTRKKLLLEDFHSRGWFQLFKSDNALVSTDKFLGLLCRVKVAVRGHKGFEVSEEKSAAFTGNGGQSPELSWIMALGIFSDPFMQMACGMAGDSGYFDSLRVPQKLNEVEDILWKFPAVLPIYVLSCQLEGLVGEISPSVGKKTQVGDPVHKTSGLLDASKASSLEHAQDDDVFIAKGIRNSLSVRAQSGEKEEKQILHVLVDTSFSMRKNGKITLAKAFSIALLRKVSERGDVYVVQSFSGAPGPYMVVHDKDSLGKGVKYIQDMQPSGTTALYASILAALSCDKQVLESLREKGVKKWKKQEVLVISDGLDSASQGESRKKAEELKKKSGAKVYQIVLEKLPVLTLFDKTWKPIKDEDGNYRLQRLDVDEL